MDVNSIDYQVALLALRGVDEALKNWSKDWQFEVKYALDSRQQQPKNFFLVSSASSTNSIGRICLIKVEAGVKDAGGSVSWTTLELFYSGNAAINGADLSTNHWIAAIRVWLQTLIDRVPNVEHKEHIQQALRSCQ